MKRKYQVFRAHLPPGQTLALVPSPWFEAPDVNIPLEHWDILRRLAVDAGLISPELWDTMSELDGRGCEPMELRMFCTVLKIMQRELRADMERMLQLTASCPEPLPGFEHARMLEAVIRVLEMSGSKADSWTE